MNKYILPVILVAIVLLSSFSVAEARARYGSVRVGGYNSHGKGSHYVGGYVRSTPIRYGR